LFEKKIWRGKMPIKDRMSYLPIVRGSDGVDRVAERDICDLDRATTIKDIAGSQIENLVQVIEFNPVEGTSRDVSEDMAREVMTIWAHAGEPLTHFQYDFVEQFIGTRAARSFLRAA
jgi:hypothetical protein